MLSKIESVRSLAEQEAEGFTLPSDCLKDRLPVEGFAVDGPDARERDDAIHFEKTSDGYLVRVSITDVGSFVGPESYMSDYAARLGFTRYGPEYTVPMLPASISRGVLSFTRNIESPALTVDISLSPDFDIVEVGLAKSRINPICATYPEVNVLLNPKRTSAEAVMMQGYMELALNLMKKRQQEGGSRHYTIDQKKGLYRIRDHRKGRDLYPSEFIVEQFMVLANQAVAEFMRDSDVPAMYRNNPMSLQIDFKKAVEALISGDISVIESLAPTPGISKYSAKVLGHAALGLDAYMHFTSPLRRYPDLLNQRNVVAFLEGNGHTHSKNGLKRSATRINGIVDQIRARGEMAGVSAEARIGNSCLRSCVLSLPSFLKDKDTDEQTSSDIVKSAVKQMIENGLVDPTAICKITLNGYQHNEAWHELADCAAKGVIYGEYDPMAILNAAKRTHLIRDAEVLDVRKQGGRSAKQFDCRIRIAHSDRTTAIYAGSGSTAANAQTSAAIKAFAGLYSGKLD